MSSASHDHGEVHDAFGVQRSDPTQTTTLRDEFGSELYKRFRRIKGLVWQGIGVEDRLGIDDGDLGANQPNPPDVPDGQPAPQVPPGEGGVHSTFIEWFDDRQSEMVIGPELPDGTRWSDEYVRHAYRKGADDASRRVARIDAGASGSASVGFDVPIHRNTLETLMERNERGLEGITAETRKQVARTLADGMLEGRNPKDIARDINDRVDKIGITRARTHARTTVVGSYNEASLRRYEQMMGADAEVTVLAEFQTARDSRVCPECASMEGRRYSVREARGVIPVHPRCRCAWAPVTGSTETSEGPLSGFL